MKPSQRSLKPHLSRWVQDNLITQDQANSILLKYPTDSRSPATITFLLGLAAVFAGYKLHRRHLVTLGVIVEAIIILSFYVRLAGSMLSTGMLFLSAGTLLLIVIFALHKLQRTILK
jgi:uncharacterized membrane protein